MPGEKLIVGGSVPTTEFAPEIFVDEYTREGRGQGLSIALRREHHPALRQRVSRLHARVADDRDPERNSSDAGSSARRELTSSAQQDISIREQLRQLLGLQKPADAHTHSAPLERRGKQIRDLGRAPTKDVKLKARRL